MAGMSITSGTMGVKVDLRGPEGLFCSGGGLETSRRKRRGRITMVVFVVFLVAKSGGQGREVKVGGARVVGRASWSREEVDAFKAGRER